MKATGERHGTRHTIREEKLRRQRIILALFMTVLASFSGFFAFSILNKPTATPAVSFKAAIVDQLSGTFPNPSFSDNARTILTGAGYTVDYYSPEQVTVEFFRSLPSKGYGLVIIRAHSSGYGTIPGQEITVFTSEAYDRNKYVYEQVTDRVERASIGSAADSLLGVGQFYFSISPLFVEHSMRGEFPNSIIIMMGCTGLINSNMAKAFVARGARVYISWDESVSADRTDKATIVVLQSLGRGETVEQAVRAAMDETGPDPVYNSQLAYYPEDQGGLALSLHNSQNQMLSVQIRLELRTPGESKSFAT